MIRHEGIHHASLIVTDLERAKTFYEHVIGLRKATSRRTIRFSGAWYAIGGGGQQLHLIVHGGETLREGGIDTRDGHFAIRVADFDKTIAWLDRCGIEHRDNRNSITDRADLPDGPRPQHHRAERRPLSAAGNPKPNASAGCARLFLSGIRKRGCRSRSWR